MNSLDRIVQTVAAVLALATLPVPASAQFFAACRDGSERDLRDSLKAHNEHIYRLEGKFRDVWYLQGAVPVEVGRTVSLETVRSYLAALPGRKSAVLFHAADGNRLCTWLLPYRGALVSELTPMNKIDWDALEPQLWQTLAVRGVDHARHAAPLPEVDGTSGPGWKDVLGRISALLIPPRVVATLVKEQIDTLIVIPITVRSFDPATDMPDVPRSRSSASGRDKQDTSLARRLTLTIATIPLAALPVGNQMLIDRMSVIVAPGFFIFAQDPASATARVSTPVVVGDPANPAFRALPGAAEEAQIVAAALNTAPLAGKQATRSAIESRIRQNADRVDYIHLATHGLADAVNPLDGSYLVLHDGLWSARDIGRLRQPVPGVTDRRRGQLDAPLLQAKPLVVMSACQTALGKDFDVGTTGLARAWLWAGASNVVMSLWSVDDLATKDLMKVFVDHVQQGVPADQAMRKAALTLRESRPSPAYWASFGVFGAPQAQRKQ